MKKLFSIGIAALCWSCVPPMSLYTALAASLLDGCCRMVSSPRPHRV